MVKWIVRAITKELNEELLDLQKKLIIAFGYNDIRIRDACKIIVEKNKRFSFNLDEMRKILGGKK